MYGPCLALIKRRPSVWDPMYSSHSRCGNCNSYCCSNYCYILYPTPFALADKYIVFIFINLYWLFLDWVIGFLYRHDFNIDIFFLPKFLKKINRHCQGEGYPSIYLLYCNIIILEDTGPPNQVLKFWMQFNFLCYKDFMDTPMDVEW